MIDFYEIDLFIEKRFLNALLFLDHRRRVSVDYQLKSLFDYSFEMLHDKQSFAVELFLSPDGDGDDDDDDDDDNGNVYAYVYEFVLMLLIRSLMNCFHLIIPEK